MRIADYWQRMQSSLFRQQRARDSRRRLFLESLEERTVPTILWGNAGSRMVVDEGGPVITHPDVDLIFWGAGWNNAQPLMNSVTTSISTFLSSSYMSGLSQYRGVGNGQVLRTDLITSSSPGSQTNDSQFDSFVRNNLNNGSLPVTPNMDSQILYVVVPQPGTIDLIDQAAGEHGYNQSNFGRFYYAWTENTTNPTINPTKNALDDITDTLSHEITESATDPMGNAFIVPSTGDEISDGDAVNYDYRLDGVLVQSFLSQKDHAYAVYDGTVQKFVLTSTGALTVNGDQLPNPSDTITITTLNGGYQVDLNGEIVQFLAHDPYSGRTVVGSITVNTGTGNDTVNIEGTVPGLLSGVTVVTVNLGDGTDTVNLSPTAEDLGNLPGGITIKGGSGSDSLNLLDANNSGSLNYTITSTTIARPGMATVTYHNMANVTLTTSSGNDTITAQNTAAGTAVVITGGGGNDTLLGSKASNTWNITGSNTGLLSSTMIAGPVSFAGVQNLSGGGGNDDFVFSDGAGLTGNLDGGSGGGGTLDFSAYSSSVIVDLQSGTATGVGGSIANIQNVLGGNGGGASIYNILVGNGGNTLTGGNGRRNLLIAGASASTLLGGDDDDILIGGTTAYDMDIASLMAIMDYWSGTSDDYATRVGNLLSGNGVPLLDATMVTSNGGGNTLTGGAGLNLYYGNTADTTDYDPNSGAVFVPF
jgi:hypothetical protein